MTQIYLVDNSVTQRVHRSPEVAAALAELTETGQLGSCLPQLLEQGFSAQSASEHRRIIAQSRRATTYLAPTEEIGRLAVDLQSKLFAAGKGRAVGVSDLQIAATALYYTDSTQQVTIVHYDSDFDHAAEVEPSLRTHWIVPRGSVA